MGAHYRDCADTERCPRPPESLVGLLSGAGGTPRLPRSWALNVLCPFCLTALGSRARRHSMPDW